MTNPLIARIQSMLNPPESPSRDDWINAFAKNSRVLVQEWRHGNLTYDEFLYWLDQIMASRDTVQLTHEGFEVDWNCRNEELPDSDFKVQEEQSPQEDNWPSSDEELMKRNF